MTSNRETPAGRTGSQADAFRALHQRDAIFFLPNPWDIGSAKVLESSGVSALATTSSGLAASLGKNDYEVTRDELVAHVEAVAGSVSIPVTVDSERCFADDLAGVATTVRMLADAGAAGCSIEDYDAATGEIDAQAKATERVAAAVTEAAAHGLVLTARAERHLYGADDLSETIDRLIAFRDVGAEVLYAPGLIQLDEIERVVATVATPVNVLLRPNGPTIAELGSVGVRRASTGGTLAWAAYGGLAAAATELAERGTWDFTARSLSGDDRARIFGTN